MIKIRQIPFRRGFVLGFLGVKLPVPFGGGKIQVMLVFECSQRMKVRI